MPSISDFFEELEEWKKQHLSPFCLEECTRTCCDLSRFEVVKLNKEELIRVLGKEPDNYKDYETSQGNFTFREMCPQYKQETRECQIHKENPLACKTYPFYFQLSEFPALSYMFILDGCDFSKNKEAINSLRTLAHKYQIAVLEPNNS